MRFSAGTSQSDLTLEIQTLSIHHYRIPKYAAALDVIFFI